jgi:DNA-binding NarL/FixJ family response regulator
LTPSHVRRRSDEAAQSIEHTGGVAPGTSTSLIRSPDASVGAGPITVMLGRFDALVSRGLAQLLCEDHAVRILATDLDGASLERAVVEQAPRVVILDESSVAQRSVLTCLREAQPTTGIIVLAHQPTVAYGIRLFAGGANCLAKDVSAADILAAVHIAAQGRRVFADVDGHLIERDHPDTAELTPREVEVLEYLSRGQSHAEIAHALRLGAETVRTHTAHIRRKVGVRSNRQLIGLPVPRDLRRGLL